MRWSEKQLEDFQRARNAVPYKPHDTSLRPFAPPPPIVNVVDLPTPPSVNRIWRAHKSGKGRVSISPEYRRWITEADALAASTGALKHCKVIRGKFRAVITLQFRPNSDLDNRIKGVLDWAEQRALIANDKHCIELTVRWGDKEQAPAGCRLLVAEVA